jgi:D-amino-acid dehydrogenase
MSGIRVAGEFAREKGGEIAMRRSVLVLGGGVIGLSSAYYAARSGCEVTVVERASADRDGCSFGNAGMVVPSHFIPLAAPGMVALGLKWMWNPESPFYIKPRLDWELMDWAWKFWRASTSAHVRRSAPLLRDLSMASRACFEELSELSGNTFDLVKKGLLMLCQSQETLEHEGTTAEQARALGIPAEVLNTAQTAALDPAVRMQIAGAIYFPNDCHLSPNRFMARLQELAEKGGVRFLWETDVTGWKRSAERIDAVVTTQGSLAADEFVLCGGSWSAGMAKGLGLILPMQAGKGYSLTLPNPPQLPQICAILTEARVAATPMGSALRFGGTMELAGLNEAINPLRVQGIIKAVSKYYPEFTAADFEGVQPWRGLRPCSPDGLPYLGRTNLYKNLIVATGHAMMGLSLGPVTGKLVAEMATEGRPSLPLDLLAPDRFA